MVVRFKQKAFECALLSFQFLSYREFFFYKVSLNLVYVPCNVSTSLCKSTILYVLDEQLQSMLL